MAESYPNGYITRNEQFLLFPQCFQKACFLVASEGVIVWEWVKHLLLQNHWANLDETWQECSLGEALPKLFKEFNSTHNSGCHGNKKKKNPKSLKIFFSETGRRRALIFGM